MWLWSSYTANHSWKGKARASADCYTRSDKLKVKIKKLRPQA